MGRIHWGDGHETNAEDVFAAIRDAERVYDIYKRVCLALDAGGVWDEIDSGLPGKPTLNGWYGYMTGRMHLDLEQIIGTFRDMEGRPIYAEVETRLPAEPSELSDE